MKYLRLCLLIAATVACAAAKAQAVTEFCPAQVVRATPIAPVRGVSNEYAYELTALAPRKVDATIIADTDAGWFQWKVTAVPLVAATETRTSVDLHPFEREAPFTVSTRNLGRSEPLAVRFPSLVAVRHAWITNAQASDDGVFGWASHGNVQCEVPAFADSGIPQPNPKPTATPNYVVAPPTPMPSPAVAPVSATKAAAPFEPLTCAIPFREGLPKHIVDPEFNERMIHEGVNGQFSAVVAVALNADGSIAEAWIDSSSTMPSVDGETLRVARLSTYTGGISYCRPVPSTYDFTADYRST